MTHPSRFILAVLLVGLSHPALAAKPAAPINLKAIPVYGSSPLRIELAWEPKSTNETGFEIYRKTGAGAFELLHTTEANVKTYNDATVTATDEYAFRVRAVNPDGGSAYTLEVQQNVRTVWPVPNSHEILHGWNDTLGEDAPDWGFHEGVDIQRIDDENSVVAARGGLVKRARSLKKEACVDIEVKVGAGKQVISMNHLNPSLDVKANTTVYAGQSLGKISKTQFSKRFVDHTHYFIHDGKNNALNIHPLSIFSNDDDKDPKKKDPKRSHHAGTPDGTFLIRKQGVNTADYLTQPVEKDVDLIAEIIDEQGTDPDQLPTTIAYWIEAPQNVADCPKFHAVKSAAAPYVLYSWESLFYGAGLTSQDLSGALVDVAQNHGPKIAVGEESYPWVNYKHYVVTNTKGTDGKPNNVDAGQYWNTNAKEDGGAVTSETANYAGKPVTTKAGEARFPDGEYLVHILASDLIHSKVALTPEKVRIENFCPVVCKCVPSGTLPRGTRLTCGFVTFNEKMDTSVDPTTIVSVNMGAVLSFVSWTPDGFSITYCVGGLQANLAYTITVGANRAKDAPPAPGGKKLDGNGDGTCGDDFTQQFTVEPKGVPGVPASSEWGLVAMSLLVVAAGAVMIRRRRVAGSPSAVI